MTNAHIFHLAPSGTDTYLKYNGSSLSWSTVTASDNDALATSGSNDVAGNPIDLNSNKLYMDYSSTASMNLSGNDIDATLEGKGSIYLKADSDANGGGISFYIGGTQYGYFNSSGEFVANNITATTELWVPVSASGGSQVQFYYNDSTHKLSVVDGATTYTYSPD